jgi:2-polyprenyl-3-methyl-5-hydroxy-6-metoxy-1,4-benzoquinol methylase
MVPLPAAALRRLEARAARARPLSVAPGAMVKLRSGLQLQRPALAYTLSPALRRLVEQRSAGRCRAVQLAADGATEAFLSEARIATNLQSAAHSLLKSFMSHYDANALLDIYRLHLLSPPQLDKLLQAADEAASEADGLPSSTSALRRFASAVDIGAGDGSMAERLLLPIAEHITCTETARRMTERIKAKLPAERCSVLDVDLSDDKYEGSAPPGLEYGGHDLAVLLNVLDRTNKPATLLRRTASLLKPGGRLVVAVPLPFHGVHYSGSSLRSPAERLHAARPGSLLPLASEDPQGAATDWCHDAAWMLTEVLGPHVPLQVRAFTRLPYISWGDVGTPFYVFDSLVAVCTKPR